MIRKHHAIAFALLIIGFTLGLMVGLERWATGPSQAQRAMAPIAESRRLGMPWEQGYHPFAPPPWIERGLRHEWQNDRFLQTPPWVKQALHDDPQSVTVKHPDVAFLPSLSPWIEQRLRHSK